ncbi:sensor histidine kinase [Chitinimonas sp. BJYL2]|uniref:sensor histidine kinase n=1 Tax=Chitinimonas sp. BJYL2 TaxID=2976696 RepID=UPI0022B49D70|nr:histidine kinase [Chitinimonas sp. BJYL2]
MWQKLVDLHRRYEDEVLIALADPTYRSPSAFRQRMLCGLEQMNPIERRQLHDFALHNRGWPGYRRFIVTPMALLSLVGLLMPLFWPHKFSWIEGVVLVNLLGLSFGFGLLAAWFNYSKLVKQGWKTFLKVIVLATAGAFFGAGIAALVDGKDMLGMFERIGKTIAIAGAGTGVVYALLVGAIGRFRAHIYEQEAARLQAETERERLARQLSESQLRLLQAQIEPHFLFNTLGAVQQLAETGAPKAAELTAHLIQFLRGSLAQMRAEQVSLEEDFALISAYLHVMQSRLGNRLDFALDLPAALVRRQIPTMMTLTLVENAIKHGIEPAVRGGDIRVSAATLANGQLCISVVDTGKGLNPGWQSGVGISNIRARLQLQFGDTARLDLHEDEGATRATLTLPHTVPMTTALTQKDTP